jgi:hypothetical protein
MSLGSKFTNFKKFFKNATLAFTLITCIYFIYGFSEFYFKDKNPHSDEFIKERFDFSDYIRCRISCYESPEGTNTLAYVNRIVFKPGMGINEVLKIIRNSSMDKSIVLSKSKNNDYHVQIGLGLNYGIFNRHSVGFRYYFDDELKLVLTRPMNPKIPDGSE